MSKIFVLMMRLMPVWSKLTAVAHTLPYDIQLIEFLRHPAVRPSET